MTPTAKRVQVRDVVKPSAVDWLYPPPTAEVPKGYVYTVGLQVVLNGWPQFGQLWWDERVNEVHIRGTQVSVCGRLGVCRVPGFGNLAMARWAIEAITAAQEEVGATITHIGDSVVVSRRQPTAPSPATLIAAGIVTEEQLSQVRTALEHTQAVILTGPAAPVVMRSFATLLPDGSRVFQGPYAAMPGWCVAAATPLDADYVVGVRPGVTAEQMAAMGQIGALVANPETQFEAAVRFAVHGRASAPEKLTSGLPNRESP
ncbi:hypothetical protein OG417_51090 [Actinoallomurus sp. NBC_01490]|jgi:hypothetical protein|uniref:hypothetical protein n=1 Tax=Actinoallomurus sp. NBC_01490 TaxID=2903557 RepID=UPI002E2F14D7|nr:hypothetical protein [Actinoallomurus sp. NBC_01490]